MSGTSHVPARNATTGCSPSSRAASTCRYSVVHTSSARRVRREPAEVVLRRGDRRVAHERRASRVAPARAARELGDRRRATARRKLRGICTASAPPVATTRDAREQRRVIRQPVQRRVAVDDVHRRIGRPRREVGLSKRTRGVARRARAPSRASAPNCRRRRCAASGQRAPSRRVTLPAPQPRSTTARGAASGTRARRSSAGRSRSSSNSRYCCGFQVIDASSFCRATVPAPRAHEHQRRREQQHDQPRHVERGDQRHAELQHLRGDAHLGDAAGRVAEHQRRRMLAASPTRARRRTRADSTIDSRTVSATAPTKRCAPRRKSGWKREPSAQPSRHWPAFDTSGGIDDRSTSRARSAESRPRASPARTRWAAPSHWNAKLPASVAAISSAKPAGVERLRALHVGVGAVDAERGDRAGHDRDDDQDAQALRGGDAIHARRRSARPASPFRPRRPARSRRCRSSCRRRPCARARCPRRSPARSRTPRRRRAGTTGPRPRARRSGVKYRPSDVPMIHWPT